MKISILQSQEFVCRWEKLITSNRELSNVFPISFDEEFLPKEILETEKKSHFFFDIDIPRYGTDTKVTLKVIPLGLSIKNNSAVSFKYYEEKHYANCTSLYRIRDIAQRIEYEKCLDYLLNGEFKMISQQEQEIIDKTIGEDDSRFKSKEELRFYLKELKQKYDLYSNLKTETVLLGWDREKARFYVKQRVPRPKVITFKEFLIKNKYWSPTC